MFINKLRIIENNHFAIVVAVISIFLSVILALTFNHDIISMKYMYFKEYLFNMISRAAIIFVSALSVVVLTRFMTNRKIVLTQIGMNSFTVYLLHPYLIKSCKVMAKPYLKNHQKLTLAFIFVMSFVIVFLLSRNCVTKALNKLLEVIYKILCIE